MFDHLYSLQEMLLQAPRRINEYVILLSWFEVHTPRSHQDRGDLEDAIDTLKELDRCIREVLNIFMKRNK